MPSFHPTHWSHLGYVGKGREVQLRRLDVTRPLVMGISLVHPLTIDSSGAYFRGNLKSRACLFSEKVTPNVSKHRNAKGITLNNP